MEQQIRYCTTDDGVRIAYATMGNGSPAYVFVPAMLGALETTWESARRQFEAVARVMTVVRYDKRGTGLSDRDIVDYSIEARASDLEAVVDDLGIDKFILYGASEGGPVAISYAARHPERVARLILIGTYASGRELRRLRSDFGEALMGLIRAEWSVASRTLGDIINPEASGEMSEQMAGIREAVSGEHVTRMLEAMGELEIEHLLPDITAPTLVIHGRNDQAIPFELGRRIAAAISGAQLHADNHGHMSDEPSRIAAMRDFIAPDRHAGQLRTANGAGWPSTSAMSVILFTDIADSTALTERMGDAAFRAASRELDDRVRAAIRENSGTPVDGKVLGDGVMGVFSSASQAVAAARDCLMASGDLPMHIGLHAGDVLHEGDNVYGGAVNIASRICGLCEPGEILVSATVRDLARTSAGVTFADRGEEMLKGIEDAVRVFAVRPTSNI